MAVITISGLESIALSNKCYDRIISLEQDSWENIFVIMRRITLSDFYNGSGISSSSQK